MARFETEGYCPHNAFSQCVANATVQSQRALDILGSRTAFMVYDKGSCTYNGVAYVVDAICGATGTMGIEIATAIKVLDPVCDYPEKGLKLSCFDMINPTAIPGIIQKSDNGWCVKGEASQTTFLFEDERFLAVIVETDEELQLYFWKK